MVMKRKKFTEKKRIPTKGRVAIVMNRVATEKQSSNPREKMQRHGRDPRCGIMMISF